MPDPTGTEGGRPTPGHGAAASTPATSSTPPTTSKGAAAHPHHGPGPLAAIGIGGALGTLARYGVERGVTAGASDVPWATLTVNVVGSFVLGVVVTLVTERWPADRLLRPLVAVGFCGGFTTFSTFAVEIDQRVRHGHAGTAAAYLVASLLAGLGAALAGITLARGHVLPAPGAPAPPDPDLLAGDDAAGGGDT